MPFDLPLMCYSLCWTPFFRFPITFFSEKSQIFASEMSTRKKTKMVTKKGKGKILVPKWKLFRAKEPLLSVFMWGINHTVDQLMHVPPPGLLMPDDFKVCERREIWNFEENFFLKIENQFFSSFFEICFFFPRYLKFFQLKKKIFLKFLCKNHNFAIFRFLWSFW